MREPNSLQLAIPVEYIEYRTRMNPHMTYYLPMGLSHPSPFLRSLHLPGPQLVDLLNRFLDHGQPDHAHGPSGTKHAGHLLQLLPLARRLLQRRSASDHGRHRARLHL